MSYSLNLVEDGGWFVLEDARFFLGVKGFGVYAVVFGEVFYEQGGDAPSERMCLGFAGLLLPLFCCWGFGWRGGGLAGFLCFGCGVGRLGLSFLLLGGEVGGGDLQGVED